MTPEQVSLVTALSNILQVVSKWPVGTVLLAVIFGPWVMVFFISHYQSKRDQHHKDRFEAVVKMYESNVELVQTTQGLAKDLKDVVILNTSEWQGTRTDVKNNQFCPMVRLKKEAKGVQG